MAQMVKCHLYVCVCVSVSVCVYFITLISYFNYCKNTLVFWGEETGSALLCSTGWPGIHYVAQAGLELPIFLPLPPTYQDYRCKSSSNN
jgi:hypothetical protein